MTGRVYLVGAGPGDPGLITMKGLAALKKADVIIYDRLASPMLLQQAKQGTEKIYVGKDPDRHICSQSGINRLIIQKAKEGNIVVRLKGGDPFVFGRGGEEAEQLVTAQIPYEVIPGISSAIAVPAYAGIPVTHRNVSSSFAVITGHECAKKSDTSINWAQLATSAETLVFLMGIKNLFLIVNRLIEHGRASSTPVALIRLGTTSQQVLLAGTLADIVPKVHQVKFKAPAVIIVGEVVNLHHKLHWFEQKPLFGRRILVTRTKSQNSQLAAMINELGGEAIEFPMIQIRPPEQIEPLDRALTHLANFDWLIFTSANGVKYFFQRLYQKQLDIRSLPAQAKVVAVGSKTAAALKEKGLMVDLVPEAYHAESLLETLKPHIHEGEKVLLPRANLARRLLPDQLKKWGCQVTAVDAYDTNITNEDATWIVEQLQVDAIDVITFTSSSTVRHFVQLLKQATHQSDSLLQNCKIACIGPITAQTASEQGLDVDIVAERSTIEGLVTALQK